WVLPGAERLGGIDRGSGAVGDRLVDQPQLVARDGGADGHSVRADSSAGMWASTGAPLRFTTQIIAAGRTSYIIGRS
ncbi:hypothetical protein MKK84_11350, partial [Methylobacterium sp. E-065]|uniref:hypothetical protein n=1 Tax=Methylobacterium sp. E-065 TaxID=2836583 RepID=UPI001FB99CCC